MATFKVTWNFSGPNGTSFNEVYAVDGPSASSAVAAPPGLITSRLQSLDQRYVFRAIRAASITGDRATATRTIILPGLAGVGTTPNPAGVAMVVNLVGAGGGSRKLWMRGLSEGIVHLNESTGMDEIRPIIDQILRNFIAFLAMAGYGILTIKKPAPGPLSFKAITKVDGVAANGLSKITTAEGNLLIQGNYITIGGTSRKVTPGLDGVFRVEESTANTVTVKYRTPGDIVTQLSGGRLRLRDFNPLSVFDLALSGFSHFGTRTTKNPITHSRGARSARRIRSSV